MLEQFIKSIIACFIKIEPMNAYIQSIPKGVKYPCYLVNKLDINTHNINSFYFLNTITPYIRIFGNNEIELKNKTFNLIQSLFESRCKIPILNEDGSKSNRYIRIEDIESINIPVDENEVYCIEINFSFDTTHIVNVKEFDLLQNVKFN